MHFFVDASLPRSVKPAIEALGHTATDVRDVGMGSAPDSDIAARARIEGMTILTRDFDFADVRNYPPENYRGIVVVQVPEDVSATAVSALLATFVSSPMLTQLAGRLAILELGRVRFRPA
jgi:predicted nuclease of predicted toxin-antitoxin system